MCVGKKQDRSKLDDAYGAIPVGAADGQPANEERRGSKTPATPGTELAATSGLCQGNTDMDNTGPARANRRDEESEESTEHAVEESIKPARLAKTCLRIGKAKAGVVRGIKQKRRKAQARA